MPKPGGVTAREGQNDAAQRAQDAYDRKRITERSIAKYHRKPSKSAVEGTLRRNRAKAAKVHEIGPGRPVRRGPNPNPNPRVRPTGSGFQVGIPTGENPTPLLRPAAGGIGIPTGERPSTPIGVGRGERPRPPGGIALPRAGRPTPLRPGAATTPPARPLTAPRAARPPGTLAQTRTARPPAPRPMTAQPRKRA